MSKSSLSIKKICMIAVMTALAVVFKAYIKVEFIGFARITFTYTLLLIAGFMFGPLYGFGIGFLSDAAGWLIAPVGDFNLFITTAAGLLAAIPGIVRYIKINDYFKIILSFGLTFAVCTVAINTTVLYLYFNKDLVYWDYLWSRLTLQTPVVLINLALSLLLWQPLKTALKKAGTVNDDGRIITNYFSLNVETEAAEKENE